MRNFVSKRVNAVPPSGIRRFFDIAATMDDIIRRLKNTPKAKGEDRIYIHGEKEFEMEKEHKVKGVVLHPKVVADMQAIAGELNIVYDL